MTEIDRADIIPRLMQLPPLPHHIDLWQLATNAGRMEGVVALAALPRLALVLNCTDGEATVVLAAKMDAQGGRVLEGEIRAEIELVCQRCLDPLRLPLVITVRLGLIRDEAKAARVPEEYEPLLVGEERFCVADLVEDELLLALPQIPRHKDLHVCQAKGYILPSDEGESVPSAESHQPFAELASLLRDSKRNH